MLSREQRLSQCEQQLWQNKQQLQILSIDITKLENEIYFLKKENEKIGQQESKSSSIPAESISTAPSTNIPIKEKATVKEKMKKDFEKTVGKSFMGIIASVLIFISLISFATLVLPLFGEVAKMVAMYVVSFAFAGVGAWRLNKDPDNRFFIAITGCGVGAVYISLLLSNIYFHAIGDILLYVLIAAWAIAVCIFAKTRHNVFQIIGQLGITASVIFGCILCVTTNDSTKFVVLILFYIISSGFFYFVHKTSEFNKNIQHYIFGLVNCIALFTTCNSMLSFGFHIGTLITALLFVGYLFLMILDNKDASNIVFGVLSVAYTLFASCTSSLLYLESFDSLPDAITIYALCAAVVVFLELKFKEKAIGVQLAQAGIICIAEFGLGLHTDFYRQGDVWLLILPLLIFGFLRRNVVFKFGGIFLATFWFITFGYHHEAERAVVGFLIIATAFFLQYKFKNQYDKLFKYGTHVVAIIYLANIVPDIVKLVDDNFRLRTAILFVAITAYNLIMSKTVFRKNLETGADESDTVFSIINIYSMIAGLICINFNINAVVHIIVIITTLAAFMMNVKNLLDKRDNAGAGIYVGIKFTWLVCTILSSFNTTDYLISIACFVLAIISIIIGFKAEYKYLRLFGLVLSIICTFKLIMVDISYENTLGYAISFFISGILCFAISLIYNYISKKTEKHEE